MGFLCSAFTMKNSFAVVKITPRKSQVWIDFTIKGIFTCAMCNESSGSKNIDIFGNESGGLFSQPVSICTELFGKTKCNTYIRNFSVIFVSDI